MLWVTLAFGGFRPVHLYTSIHLEFCLQYAHTHVQYGCSENIIYRDKYNPTIKLSGSYIVRTGGLEGVTT